MKIRIVQETGDWLMLSRIDEKLRKCPIVYITYIVLAIALIIRGFYGFCQSDESFYVSTAGRFASGDLVFVDEWHPTQLASLITAPFYLIFEKITGGTEGIILYFRVLYVVFTTSEAIIAYRLISSIGGASQGNARASVLLDKHKVSRRYSSIPAFLIGLFLMLYCHLNIPTLSYYTMSFNFFVLAFILIYAGEVAEKGSDDGFYKGYAVEAKSVRIGKGGGLKIGYYVTGGAFFALSVLSLPSLAVTYVLVMAILLIFCIKIKELRFPLLFVTAGILIPLILFVVYLYASGNSIAGLLANLTYIMSDAEHDRGIVESFKVFFRAISDVFGKIYYISIVLVFLALLTYVNDVLRKHLYHYILMADVLLFIYYVIIGGSHTGFINTAFALFVFPLFFLTEKKDLYVFLAFFMGGLAFAMTYCLSSYCDLYGLAIGHGISAAGGLLLLWDFICEAYCDKNRNDKSAKSWHNSYSRAGLLIDGLVIGSSLCVLMAFLMVTLILRISNVYRDDRLSRLDSRLDVGPAAGLITSAEHREQYDSLLASVMKYTAELNENEDVAADRGSRVLFSKLLPWGYTASELRVAAPDTWRNPISGERLMMYYRTHDMELPDVIFVVNTDVGSYETSGDVEADPIPNLNEFEGELADIIRSEYEEHTEEYCTVYIHSK